MARTKFSELRDAVVAEPGAPKRLADLRAETLQDTEAAALLGVPALAADPPLPRGSRAEPYRRRFALPGR